jgi:DNA-directed RNA polymerase alpha subunit
MRTELELWEEIAMRVAVAVVSRGVTSEVIHGGSTTVHRWHHQPNDVANYAFEVAGSMMRARNDTLDYMERMEVERELRKQEFEQKKEMDKKAQKEALATGTPITELDLTVRSQNILRAESIYTIEQLCERRASDLIRAPGMGKKSLNEIREILRARGLFLKGDEPNDDKQGS